MTDEQIIQALQSGSKRSENEVLDFINRTFYKRAKGVLKGNFLREKFDQIYFESLGDLWVNITVKNSFKAESSISTYFISIVRNRYNSYIKSHYSDKSKKGGEINENMLDGTMYSTSGADTDLMIIILETAPADCKRLLTMRFLQGMQIEVIAQKMNQLYDAVKKRIQRCRKRVQEQYNNLK